MKLKLKEFQILDTMLNAYSFLIFGSEKDSERYKMIVKIDGKLAVCNFLQFTHDSFYPVESDPISFSEKTFKRITITDLFDIFADFIHKDFDSRNRTLRRLVNYPDLLADKLIEVIKNQKIDANEEYKSNKIYNIKFLESGLNFDFYMIDHSQEFELVSLILEPEN